LKQVSFSSLQDGFFILRVQNDFESILQCRRKTELIGMLCHYAPAITFEFRDNQIVTLKGGKKTNQYSWEKNETGGNLGTLKGKKILVSGGLSKDTYPSLREPPKMPQIAVAATNEIRGPIKKAAPKQIPTSLQTSSKSKPAQSTTSPRPQPVISPKAAPVTPKPAAPKAQPKAAAATGGKDQAKALYDFDAENDDELTFKEGDIITITDKGGADWWQGEYGGRVGYFPAVYVQILMKGAAKPGGKPLPKPGGKPQPAPPKMKGKY